MTNSREITPSDLARGRKLKIQAVAAPVILTLLPAILTVLMVLLAATGPPAAAVILFAGFIATTIGFLTGVTIAVLGGRKYSAWTREIRERMAANGIKAEQIEWFRNELK